MTVLPVITSPDLATWLPPLLQVLAGREAAHPLPTAAVPDVAHWVQAHELGPLTHHLYHTIWPALGQPLLADNFAATAEGALLWHQLQRTLATLNSEGIPHALLKGAAVAHLAYPQPHLRVMSDVDVWVPAEYITAACAALQAEGFIWATDAQKLAVYGKAEFILPQWVKGSVDLQTNPFAGYWLEHMAQIDSAAVWSRLQPCTVQGQATHTLAVEDALLHAAIHLAINHQFDATALRSMVDMMRLAQIAGADWAVVAQRAHAWRVQTVWQLVGSLLAALWGPTAVVAPPLPRWRAALLRPLITPAHIAAGREIKNYRWRYLLLALLADAPPPLGRMVRGMRRNQWSDRP